MIEINLVPQQLRKRRKKDHGLLPQGLNIPKEVMIGLVGGFFSILIIISVLFQVTIFLRLAYLKSLRKQWQEVLPTKTNVDRVTNQLRTLQGKVKSIESIVGVDKISWAQKLNDISEVLPRGVWLTRIVATKQRLVIEGSAIGKGKDEMINVHNFASNLKGQEQFMKNLNDLEVGSIQRRSIKMVEIADFSITAKVK